MKSTVLICALVCPLVLCQYPSTFPFENEAYIPPETPSSTPSLTYDESDVGGYVMYYMHTHLVVTDDMFPGYCPAMTGALQNMLVNLFGAPPVIPTSVWNCSGDDHPLFAPEMFLGTVNGDRVCDDCCSYLMGTPVYGVDQQSRWQPWLDERAAANMCTDHTEQAYCVFVGGQFQTNCHQHYLSPSERLTVNLCYDEYALNLLNCAVFRTVYTPVNAHLDTPLYIAQLSNEEFLTLDAKFYASDRVCHPHSYYSPSAESSASSTSSIDSVASTDSSSSANTIYFMFTVLLSLL